MSENKITQRDVTGYKDVPVGEHYWSDCMHGFEDELRLILQQSNATLDESLISEIVLLYGRWM